MENYEILGVSRDASPEEIKHAYRQLCKKYHPDVNDAPNAAAFFRLIHAAYQEMSNATYGESTTERHAPPSSPEQPPRDKTASPPPHGQRPAKEKYAYHRADVFIYLLFGTLKVIQFLLIPVAFVAALFLSVTSAVFHVFFSYILGWIPIVFLVCFLIGSFSMAKVVFILLLVLFGLAAIFWGLANGVVNIKDWLDLKIEALAMRLLYWK